MGDAGKVECFISESTVRIGRRQPGRVRMAVDAVEEHDVPVDTRLLGAGHHHGATFFEHRAFVEAIRTAPPFARSRRRGASEATRPWWSVFKTAGQSSVKTLVECPHESQSDLWPGCPSDGVAPQSHMLNMLLRLALSAERHGPDLTSRFMKTPH